MYVQRSKRRTYMCFHVTKMAYSSP
jgi:hypothetical protein